MLPMAEGKAQKVKHTAIDVAKSKKKKRSADDEVPEIAMFAPEKKRKKASSLTGEKRKKKQTVEPLPAEAAGEDASTASDDTTLQGGDDGAPSVDPMSVDNFKLSAAIKKQLAAKGIQALFPIQAQTLDHCLAGLDLVGRAR